MMENNSAEEVSCCVEKGQDHSSVEIPEAQVHSSHSSVEIPEDDSRVLAAMEEKISNIDTLRSDEPLGNIKALIYLNCRDVEEVRVGPHARGAHDPMEQLKIQCLAYVIQRGGTNLKEYWQRMLPYKRQISESYEGSDCLHCGCATRYYSDEELFGMMILDGSFILEFFRCQFVYATAKDHPIAQVERRKLTILFRDLLQLGNQIPFLVLEQLFQICHPLFQMENDNTLTIQKQLLNIIAAVSIDALGVGTRYVGRFSYEGSKPLHLLDLIRLCFTPPHFRDIRQSNFIIRSPDIPNISKLRSSGIKVNPQYQDHYLDFAFQAGTIKMPRIILDEQMCAFLKNCVEFGHQCTSASKYKYISSYVLLLDNLVDTADDIDYLCQRGVLERHKKTNDEAAYFINNLGTKINFDGTYFKFYILCRDVNSYYQSYQSHQSELRRKWVSFKREYFDKPWLLISVLAACVLLILTCIQTHYAIHPQK